MKSRPLIVLADMRDREFGMRECFGKTRDWDAFTSGDWPLGAPRQATSKHPDIISEVCSRKRYAAQIAQCCLWIKRRNNPAVSFRN